MTRVLLVLLAILPLPALGAPTPPPACTQPEYHQLDFWVGHWDIFPTGKTTLVAHSLIESLYGGCAIRESWMPLQPGGGGSLSSFAREDGRWHQTWVDASGARVEFAGGLVDGKLVMTGFWRGVNGPGKDALIRMTYARNPDGSVRQLGEASADHGLTWTPSFDFTYRAAKK